MCSMLDIGHHFIILWIFILSIRFRKQWYFSYLSDFHFQNVTSYIFMPILYQALPIFSYIFQQQFIIASDPQMQSEDIGPPKSGLFTLKPQPLTTSPSLLTQTFPEPLSKFPFFILLTFTISNLLKLYVPFAIQDLYMNISIDNLIYPSIKFVITVLVCYYTEIRANYALQRYKIGVKGVLSERVIRAALRAPFEQLESKQKVLSSRSSWNKISQNINIYVGNYYSSYLTIIFQTLKAIFIVFYLFSKLGKVTFIGLAMGGMITQFLQFISKNIQNTNFKKLRIMELKTKILTQYFTRIVDYQMSWLDGFIGDRIQTLENQYQKQLRKAKLLDAWCVGLWQFTQIGISSVVLCLYYYYNTSVDSVQPATVIYLFQMLTFPMNAISWNIAGLHNSERAIKQLSQSQRNIQVQNKKQKAVQKFDYGFEIMQIQKKLRQNRFYAVTSDDPLTLRKLSLCLSQKNHKVGYCQQNSFFLQTFIQSLYLLPQQYISSSTIKSQKEEILRILQLCKCAQIPLQNQVSTYSGGQKMRLALARSLLHGKTVIIDSDLISLDKVTRKEVFSGLKEYAQAEAITIVVRGKKGNQDVDANVHQFIRVQEKFSRATFEVNRSQKLNLKRTITEEKQKQLLQKRKQMQQKLDQQILRLQTIEIFHPSIDFEDRTSRFSNISSNQSEQHLIPSPTLPQLNKSTAPDSMLNQNEDEQETANFRPISSTSSKSSLPASSSRFKPLTRKLKLSLLTLKFYFGHKLSHFIFVISLASMYAVGNYYNYFVNVTQVQQENANPIDFAYAILYITIMYVICIMLRSYFFAVANLNQSERICHLTNKLLIYNHISFYSKQHIIDPTPLQPLSSNSPIIEQQSQPFSPPTNQLPSHYQATSHTASSIQKLVYLCTSDQKNVNNGFPFDTNILWNNIATVIGALIMVIAEVPFVIVLVGVFIVAVRKIQNDFRVRNESLIMESKEQEVQLMKSINNIEQGNIYVHVFQRTPQFLHQFKQNLSTSLETSSQQNQLSKWMQLNFRVYMLIFLCVCILLFWVKEMIEWSQISNKSQEKILSVKKSAEMSIMVRYVLLLADYVFYLARSWADCRGKAISIERIRRCVENIGVIKGSFERLKRSKRKKQQFIKYIKENEGPFNKPFINLNNFSFQYDKRSPSVLENINLYIKPGDKLVLKGKTGSGKTTLFKILMGLYPQSYFPESSIHLLSFSSQHPLKMGQCSLLQKLDPYRILQIVPPHIRTKVMEKARKIIDKYQKNKSVPTFEDEVYINNLRAYLYGFKGLTVYDEPQFVFDDSGTYIIVTHHGKFKSNLRLMLEKGRILENKEKQQGDRSKSKKKSESPSKMRQKSKLKQKEK